MSCKFRKNIFCKLWLTHWCSMYIYVPLVPGLFPLVDLSLFPCLCVQVRGFIPSSRLLIIHTCPSVTLLSSCASKLAFPTKVITAFIKLLDYWVWASDYPWLMKRVCLQLLPNSCLPVQTIFFITTRPLTLHHSKNKPIEVSFWVWASF